MSTTRVFFLSAAFFVAASDISVTVFFFCSSMHVVRAVLYTEPDDVESDGFADLSVTYLAMMPESCSSNGVLPVRVRLLTEGSPKRSFFASLKKLATVTGLKGGFSMMGQVGPFE